MKITRKNFPCLASALLLSIAVPSQAQTNLPTNGGMTNGGMTNGGMTNGGMTNGGMTNGGMTNGGMTNGGMTNGNSTMAAPAPDGLSAMDQLFMVRAAEGNMAEISLSRLALDKTRDDGVRKIALTLITEHSKAQAQLQATATRKGVMLPKMISPTHMAVEEKLRKAKTKDFDKMYMAAQVDDHENTIALFANEISMGQDVDAKSFATTYLPNIVGHTVMIYDVARQVGAPGIELRPAMPPTPPGVTPTPMGDMGMPGMMPATPTAGM